MRREVERVKKLLKGGEKGVKIKQYRRKRERVKDCTKMEKKEKEGKRPQKGGESKRERESVKDHTSEVVREQ